MSEGEADVSIIIDRLAAHADDALKHARHDSLTMLVEVKLE